MEGWRHISMQQVRRLLLSVPERLRWDWDGRSADNHLVLRSPRGRRWEFKLKRGGWIRPLETTVEGSSRMKVQEKKGGNGLD